MRNMAFLKMELRQIQNNQTVMFEHFESIITHLQGNNTYTNNKNSLTHNDFHDCPLPLDNIIDLNTVEDKIAGDHQFKSLLVIIIAVFMLKLINLICVECIYILYLRLTSFHILVENM